jgi:hypothetical protein
MSHMMHLPILKLTRHQQNKAQSNPHKEQDDDDGRNGGFRYTVVIMESQVKDQDTDEGQYTTDVPMGFVPNRNGNAIGAPHCVGDEAEDNLQDHDDDKSETELLFV